MVLQECGAPGCSPTSPTNITIENLTFDGNRAGVQSELGNTTFCSENQSNYVDLMLDNGSQYGNAPVSIITVENVDFNNAPAQSLQLDGTSTATEASTVSYSNWATGGSTSGGRYTGIILEGQDSGAYYNVIDYQGTAAIQITEGTTNYVYGNTMDNDRYEMPDGGGGMVTLYATSKSAQVASNWIDSGSLYSGSGYTFRGCGVPAGSSPEGVEITTAAESPSFYNNQVQYNYAVGYEISADARPSDITFSGSNPWDSEDPYKCTSYNGWRGIWFYGSGSEEINVTFSDVCVTHTTGAVSPPAYGINLSNVQGTGFINDACMHNNYTSSSYDITSVGSYVALANPTPGNRTTCYGVQ
jgi:hypothetical protein